MSNMRDGYHAACDAVARGLQPDSNLTVDEWADRYMIIPKSSGSNEYGPYRTSRTPHARAVMRALSDGHPCKRVVVKAASQMLKTQVALNWLCASIDQSPSNFLWLMPTGKLHKRIAARIAKTIQAVARVMARVAKPHSRDAANNMDTKEYQGGALFMATAGAASNLAEVPARRLVFDEVDRADLNVNGEGDPVELGENRQTTFERNRKSYYPSSPTIEGESIIDDLFKRGTQRVALAECIHCHHAQPLDFFRLIASEDGTRVMYPCIDCGGLMEEGDKNRMFVQGLWTDGQPGDGETESFTISAMFLPYGWIPWIALHRQYLKAKAKLDEGSEEAMIVFYNTRLALTWSRTKEATKWEVLKERAEDYRLGSVAMEGLVVTATIDTQNERLEFKAVAWGEGMEGWVIDYQVINGSPAEDSTWLQADKLLLGRYRHASGHMLNISAAFVDSGGGHTQEVYNFTRSRKRRNVFAVKGHSRPNKPVLSAKPTLVDVNHRGKMAKKDAQLWFVGPDTAKDYLTARWKREKGPGAIHFSKDLPDSYFKGLTAEYRVSGYKRGHKVSWYEKKKGEPNEPLDLMVYNLGAAYFLGLHRKTENAWQNLRDRLFPIQHDLLEVDTYPQGEGPAEPAPAPARRLPLAQSPGHASPPKAPGSATAPGSGRVPLATAWKGKR